MRVGETDMLKRCVRHRLSCKTVVQTNAREYQEDFKNNGNAKRGHQFRTVSFNGANFEIHQTHLVLNCFKQTDGAANMRWPKKRPNMTKVLCGPCPTIT